MPRLAPLGWRAPFGVFEADGFAVDHQHGSHIVMVKDGGARPLVIPRKRSVATRIILNNMRTVGMSRERFFELPGR